jgi:hypothetical protein
MLQSGQPVYNIEHMQRDLQIVRTNLQREHIQQIVRLLKLHDFVTCIFNQIVLLSST